MAMTLQFADTTSSIFLTLPCFFCQVYLLVQVSYQYHYWFWVMLIFLYNGLTRNPKIRNILLWVFPNIWRLGRVRDTKFGINVSNEMLLNTAKYQGYSFYRSWVIKRKATGGGVKLHPQSQIRVKESLP